MDLVKKTIAALLILIIAVNVVACGTPEPAYQSVSGTIVNISKYGNIGISATKAEMAEKGYEFGDIVTVSFADKSIDIPYCGTYSDVDAGSPGLFGRYDDETLTVAVNVGDFATIYGIAEKITNEDKTYEWVYNEGIDETLTFEISMKEKRGYYEEYVVRQLVYTDERADYPDLTDEQFGNFRAVSTTGMGKNVLYRSATPVDPQKNRNTYVDAAAREHGITIIIDLNDTEESLPDFEGYETSYFAETEHIALNMGLDFTQKDFKDKLCEGLRYMSEHDGIYLIHCLEGKDRTGFVIALLEFLMGADYDEAEADYMVTYYNYYGVKKGEEKYDVISHSNFEKNLLRSFGVESIKDRDLVRLAEEYIKSIGLTDMEISALKANLSS